VAVRIALGASRGRLIRDAIGESLLLSLLGGAVAVAFALVSVRALHASIPIELPFWMTFDLDWRVWVYACALVLAIGTAAGLAPALQAFRDDHDRVLKEEGRGAAGGRATRVGRGLLVVSEVSFSLVLLIGAGLMIRSFLNLRHVDAGFRSDNLLVVYVSPPGDRYKATPPYPAYTSLYKRVLERLRELPSVEGAAGTRVIPYAGKGAIGPGTPVTLEGQSASEQERNPPVRGITISPDYFRVAGIPLLQGRTFTEDETLARPRVAIVNDAMARRLWPGAEPLGQRIKPGGISTKDDWYTVIGVVGSVKYSGLHVDSELTLYYPYTQRSAGDLHFLIRTHGAPLALVDAVQREIWSVDPDLAIYSLRSMTSILANSIWQQRLWGAVFSVFAIIAVVLALIGIYGVLAWSVRQRHREFGIRIALGAQRHDIVALIVSQGMRLVFVGVAAGLVASAILTRSLSSLLFGISASDPLIWLGVLVLLAAACAVACYAPARRASTVDPIAVLKQG
jgi:putative ABC transport system permease protein